MTNTIDTAAVMNAPTIADRIIDRLLCGDGCQRRTRLGVRREDLVARIGRILRDRLGNIAGWRFSDGSEVHVYGDGWDTPTGWEENT